MAAGFCLVALLAADTALIAAHLAYRADPGMGPLFDLGTDGGYGEMLQYLKAGVAALLLAWLCSRRREQVYGAWALIFCFVVLDDSLRIHEVGGQALGERLGYPDALGLGAADLGELTVWAGFGLPLLALLALAYLRAGAQARAASRRLAALFALLAGFGAGVDMLHVIADRYGLRGFGLAEDAGEMLALSLVCAFVVALVGRGAAAPLAPRRIIPQ